MSHVRLGSTSIQAVASIELSLALELPPTTKPRSGENPGWRAPVGPGRVRGLRRRVRCGGLARPPTRRRTPSAGRWRSRDRGMCRRCRCRRRSFPAEHATAPHPHRTRSRPLRSSPGHMPARGAVGCPRSTTHRPATGYATVASRTAAPMRRRRFGRRVERSRPAIRSEAAFWNVVACRYRGRRRARRRRASRRWRMDGLVASGTRPGAAESAGSCRATSVRPALPCRTAAAGSRPTRGRPPRTARPAETAQR